MKYLLDAVVILIFLLCMAIGRKRGFIKTVSGVVALAAALAVSSLFCSPVAEFVYDKTIEPSIIETVDTQMAQAQGDLNERFAHTYEALPNVVKNLFAQSGIDSAQKFAASVPFVGTTSISQEIADMVRPLLLPLLSALCSLVLFLITYIVASLILRVLNIVAKLPLLKQLNKTLGLIGGAVAGALWVLVAVTVIQVIAALGVADGVITLQTVNETLIVNWLSGINPLSGALIDVINGAIIE